MLRSGGCWRPVDPDVIQHTPPASAECVCARVFVRQTLESAKNVLATESLQDELFIYSVLQGNPD